MTQIWQGDKVIAVTQVKAGPCSVSAIKTNERDGYTAVQLAFADRKEKNIKKPQLVQFKKLGIRPRYVKEFRVEVLPENLKLGDKINVNTFAAGDPVQATGTSKGKGFQGVVKRHGFAGAPASHGTKDQLRMPGSIGATGPAHVFKGMRMPGRMGNDRVTTIGLEIIEVDEVNNILFVKGSVPGATNGLVMIQGEGELKITEEKLKAEEKTVEVKTEEKPEEKPAKEAKEAKEGVKETKVKETKVEEPKKEENKEADKK